MSYKPTRTFNGQVGEPSSDTMGPEALSLDIDKIVKMFDPTATHTGGEQGGISPDNLNFPIAYGTTIAPEYSSSSNYGVGEFCIYQNKLYKCIVAIPVAEAWNEAHWTENSISSDVRLNNTSRHLHNNKLLLDSYNQTNQSITSAVTNSHTHSNKSLLDSYQQTESDLADAVSKKHSHTNKSVLDAITDVVKGQYDRLVSLFSGITRTTQTLTTLNTDIPTCKAVYDALVESGNGDMLKIAYDPTTSGVVNPVLTAGGIPAYVAQSTVSGITFTTTAPTAANTNGLKICVLSSEPATKYDGWLYFITES